MKYLCVMRCYDNSKQRGYYEEEVYPLAPGEVKHLESIGLLKYFKAFPAEEVAQEKEAKKPGGSTKDKNPELPDKE